MRLFYPSVFGSTLSYFLMDVTELGRSPSDETVRNRVLEGLKHVSQMAAEIDSSSLIKDSASRLVEKYNEIDPSLMCGHCQALYNNILLEAQGRVYYQIDGEYKPFFKDGAVPFGILVDQRFSDARDDVVAAARCLALGESNATVFHLMRVLERGLHAFAGNVGVKDFSLENWKNIIDQIEKKIREIEGAPKSPEKSERVRQLSSAAVQFRYFKDAWRNHVAHSRAWYDEHSSKSIFEHVKKFMQEMASIINAQPS